jgi:oligopeptide/dipeptide ABC transporter ATP-binding protein
MSELLGARETLPLVGTGTATGRTSAVTAEAPLLEVRDLSVVFELPQGDLHAVESVSFTLSKGSTLGIAGESGSGKSVMARALMGLLPRGISRVSGSARFGSAELVGMSNKQFRQFRGAAIAMVFQDPMRSFNPIKTVGDQIAEGIRVNEHVRNAEAKRRAIEMLDLVQIPDAKARFASYPHQLSGGMRQRVMIAMALSRRPQLLIADEPTTALDVTTQMAIMDLLAELQEELGMAVIFITHDLNLAATFTHEVAVMYGGRVVERIASARVLDDLRMPYAKALIDSIPSMTEEPHAVLPAIEGVRPDPLALPLGCAFHPRCAYALDECRTEAPQLVEGEPGHWWACWNPLESEGH